MIFFLSFIFDFFLKKKKKKKAEEKYTVNPDILPKRRRGLFQV